MNSQSSLRGKRILIAKPGLDVQESRAAIMNMFRVPLNFIVVLLMSHIHLLASSTVLYYLSGSVIDQLS